MQNLLRHMRKGGLVLAAFTLLSLTTLFHVKPASAYGAVLNSGESLTNNKLVSPDGQFAMLMQADGNLVMYFWPTAYWATNTSVAPGLTSTLVMQGDGNLVIYRYDTPTSRTAIWASGTAGNNGAYLILQDDGNLVMRTADGHVIWSPNAVPSQMGNDQTLYANQQLFSPNRQYRLLMQNDGNAVVYAGQTAVWASGTNAPGSYLTMQSDGNLVVYHPEPNNAPRTVKWASGKTGPIGSGQQYRLSVQNDGSLHIYLNGSQFWSSLDQAPPASGTNAQLANQILALGSTGKITIYDYSENPASDRADRSLASLELQDIAAGKPAHLSTRCTNDPSTTMLVQPNTQLLRFLADLGEQSHYTLNTLFGQCHTSSTSYHYQGKAVDFACGLDVATANSVGSKYGVSRNSENCANNGHWHYSVGGL